jgi:hypothetical protein
MLLLDFAARRDLQAPSEAGEAEVPRGDNRRALLEVALSSVVVLEVLVRSIKVPRLSRQTDSKLKDPFRMKNH